MTNEPDTIEEQLKEAMSQIRYRDNIIAAMTAERKELQSQIEELAVGNANLRQRIIDILENQCRCGEKACSEAVESICRPKADK